MTVAMNRVRLFCCNMSPGRSNSTAHRLGSFCCHTKLISQKFGLQLHHSVIASACSARSKMMATTTAALS
jgi:hypothetical protein